MTRISLLIAAALGGFALQLGARAQDSDGHTLSGQQAVGNDAAAAAARAPVPGISASPGRPLEGNVPRPPLHPRWKRPRGRVNGGRKQAFSVARVLAVLAAAAALLVGGVSCLVYYCRASRRRRAGEATSAKSAHLLQRSSRADVPEALLMTARPSGSFPTVSVHKSPSPGSSAAKGHSSGTVHTTDSANALFTPHERLAAAPRRRRSTLCEDGLRSQLEAALDNVLATTPPIAFAGRYALLRAREHGGQALVQFARSVHDGVEQVAIKFFCSRSAYDTEVAMFADPTLAETLPAVHRVCANIPSADDMLVVSPSGWVYPPFIVMDRGFPLAAWMRAHRAVTSVLSMCQEVAELLNVLHGAGRVHRDLKPDNVLCMMNSHMRWHLIDFGIAGWQGDRAPPDCTPSYAAPEILHAREHGEHVTVSCAHDIWALGVMVYECLTGCLIFGGCTTQEHLHACANGKAKYPWEEDEGPDSVIANLRCADELLACLSRDPTARPSASKLVYSIKRLGNRTTTNNADELSARVSKADRLKADF